MSEQEKQHNTSLVWPLPTARELFEQAEGPSNIPETWVDGDSPVMYFAGDSDVRRARVEAVYRRVMASELGISPEDVELPTFK